MTLSDRVEFSVVVVFELPQLPGMVTLHFLPHFLEHVSQLDQDSEWEGYIMSQHSIG